MTPTAAAVTNTTEPTATGAYGLRIDGLDGNAAGLQPTAPDALTLTLSWTVNHPEADDGTPSSMTAEQADLRLRGGGRLRMRRGDDHARFLFGEFPGFDELVHPYLAPAAALVQLWHGNEAFHAGAVAVGNQAVLILGNKEDGKSTTLAWMAHHRNVDVIADDLAIVVGDEVLAGPRCIDVRANSAIDPRSLGGERLVRDRERCRVALPPTPPRLPIASVVLLAWGEGTSLRPVPLVERLPALVAQRMFHVQIATDPHALLHLAGLPMHTLTRPRGAAGLASAVDLLLGQLS